MLKLLVNALDYFVSFLDHLIKLFMEFLIDY